MNPNDTVKELDMKLDSWEINGKKYYLLKKMPPRRYVEYLKLLPEIVFNTTFAGLHDTMVKIWEQSRSGNDIIGALHGVSELAYNQLKSIVDFEKREHPKILEYCALILVREGENLTEHDENLVQDKITDFEADTYSMQSFFLLAKHSVPHFSKVYSELQESVSEELNPLA